MRSLAVVGDAQELDSRVRGRAWVSARLSEALVAEAPIARKDVPVLLWLVGLNAFERHAVQRRPLLEGHRHKFGFVVDAEPRNDAGGPQEHTSLSRRATRRAPGATW